jgi:hypothetical protein
MPTPQPRTPPLWPVLVAFGVSVALAALAVVMAISASRPDAPEPGPLGPLSILVAVPVDDGIERAVMEEGGCRQPLFADARVRGDAVELTGELGSHALAFVTVPGVASSSPRKERT